MCLNLHFIFWLVDIRAGELHIGLTYNLRINALLVFVVPGMPACAFEQMKSSSKSANRLFELGPYPLLISLKARGLCGKEDECFGIKKEPITEGRSCPTEGAKARLRCEAR